MRQHTLQLIIQQIDDKWFDSRVQTFDEHPLFDKKSDKLKWSFISKAPKYSDEELEILNDIEDYEVRTKDEKVTVEKDFGEFLRDHKTLPEYDYKQPLNMFYDPWKVADFKGLESICLHEIDNVLKQTNSLQEKYLILSKCEQIIKKESDKQGQIIKGLGYHFFAFHFSISQTMRNDSKYQDVFWFTEYCMKLKKEDAPTEGPKPKPKKLNKENFRILFELFDEDHNPLISDEDLHKVDEFIDCFYELYNGRQPKKKVVVNIGWKAEPFYYLIRKIFDTKPKIPLNKFCEFGCITLKGKKLIPNLISKGAGDYRNNKGQETFREYIDSEMLFER